MKEDDLYQKTRGNMVFSVYMRRRYKHDIAPPGKKTKMPLPRRNTPKGDISEKDDFYPRKYSISAETPRCLTPYKGPKKQPPEMFCKKRCS